MFGPPPVLLLSLRCFIPLIKEKKFQTLQLGQQKMRRWANAEEARTHFAVGLLQLQCAGRLVSLPSSWLGTCHALRFCYKGHTFPEMWKKENRADQVKPGLTMPYFLIGAAQVKPVSKCPASFWCCKQLSPVPGEEALTDENQATFLRPPRKT